eukprot:TRINITY_DN26982_c0_g1_i3.p1 TRINITY_DN26982_c0_g1~~TRINITY_DN26982_c0_g1_i3.p1  ORF type:complete len:181 (+),score=4.19 TRINITY_DN26982_c0_g1_i3:161-703(+)
MDHHWIKTNGSIVRDVCVVCGLTVGSLFSLGGMRCCWCQRNVHTECLNAALKSSPTQSSPTPSSTGSGRGWTFLCDLGPLRKLIVPPTGVRPLRTPVTSKSHPHILRLTRKHSENDSKSLVQRSFSVAKNVARQSRDQVSRTIRRGKQGMQLMTNRFLRKEIGRAVQQECRDRSRMPSSA